VREDIVIPSEPASDAFAPEGNGFPGVASAEALKGIFFTSAVKQVPNVSSGPSTLAELGGTVAALVGTVEAGGRTAGPSANAQTAAAKGFIGPASALARPVFVFLCFLATFEANRREAGAALRLVNVLPDCGAPLTALAPARVSSPASAEAFSFSSADEEEDELADEADDERLVKRENIFILSWREICGGASKDFAAARAGRPFVGARSRFDPRPSFDYGF
jgi:hypothetical protein